VLVEFAPLGGCNLLGPIGLGILPHKWSLVVVDAARGASCKDEADACLFATDVDASQGFSCGECFAFEVGFSFVRLPSSE